MLSVLDQRITEAIQERSIFSFVASEVRPLPSEMPDFFSNDYLSLSTLPSVQVDLCKKLQASERLLGASGARPGQGTTYTHLEFERLLCEHYNSPAALLSPSGYSANVSFLGAVPQKGDVLIHDELIHASCHDGMKSSRAKNAIYSFKHNSVSALNECITRVLKEHPQVSAGSATAFLIVESIYSE
jgi:8-amino-7-oxononanoate synthase